MNKQSSPTLPGLASLALRSQPRLWVKELAIYREFKSDAEIRRVTLRPGLNIVWAKDSESGASGHAAGKSTFCRMLRYLIGDQSFGSDTFRAAFRNKFPDGCLLGEVHLDGTPWIIVRPLNRSGHHWCSRDATWDAIFAEETRHQDYQDFVAELKLRFIAPLASATFPGTERAVQWMHLLQWLTRDQDARFSHLLEWRPTAGDGGDGKHLSAGEKTNLIRMVLGLLTPEEHLSQEAHALLLATYNTLDGEVPKLIYTRNRTVDALSSKCLIPTPDKTDLTMLLAETAKKLLADIEALEKDFAEANRHDGVGEVLATNLLHATRRRSDLESTHDRQSDHVKLQRLRLRHQKGELSEEELRAQSAELGDIKGKCSNSLEMAHAFSCPIAPQLQRDELQEERIRTARSSTGHLEEQLRLDEEARAVTKQQLDDVQKTETLLLDKITGMRTAHAKLRGDLHKDLSARRTIKEAVDRAVTDDDEILEKRVLLKTAKSEVTASQKNLATLRKESSKRLTELSEHFSQVASVLLNQTVDGSVRFNSDEIVPDLHYDGDMSSAALVTLRLLIFDLACLSGSVGPFAHHPGFLLHDSPREADLSASIYRRIFTLIAGEVENEAVQYIIATTEPPPNTRASEPWLVCELSSAEPDLRFLLAVI